MKPYLIPGFKNWVISIIGCKFQVVLALIYVHDGKEEILSPQKLLLTFEHNIKGGISCSSDGESLDWDNQGLEPSDLGEYGEEIVKDISHLPCWKHLIGNTLKDVKLLESLQGSCVIGLKFIFENGLSVSLVNLGDELFVFESLPEEIMREGIRIISATAVRRTP